jgi:hypothetical protein
MFAGMNCGMGAVVTEQATVKEESNLIQTLHLKSTENTGRI